jgi:hypothetical protein
MSDKLCKFEQSGPGVVLCRVCGSEMETSSLPERCFRKCAGEPPSRGLGDTIAKLTHATGIAQAVEAVSGALGVPCGCKERQEWLNKVMPYETPSTTTE